jgi:hypothetical protein
MIATFAPLGGLNTEVSLNAVAPFAGIAICAPAGTTETRAKATIRRFMVKPILAATSPPSNKPSQIHALTDVISTEARSAEWRNLFFNPYRVSTQNTSLFRLSSFAEQGSQRALLSHRSWHEHLLLLCLPVLSPKGICFCF